MRTAYIVMDSAAKMPSSCWGSYRRVAVLEVRRDPQGRALRPHAIDARARGVVRIVRTWERLREGTTHRSVYQRALEAASALQARLTAQSERVEALEHTLRVLLRERHRAGWTSRDIGPIVAELRKARADHV